MATARVPCPSCRVNLPGGPGEWAALTACPSCAAPMEITVFPACGRGPTQGKRGENRGTDSDAACFFHPSKRAVLPCDQCGRYLCALCDLPLDGRHICPTCLNAPTKGQTDHRRLSAFENGRTRWDLIVWALILGPWVTGVFVALAPLTSLIALGVGAWRYKSPPSRIQRSRLRLVLGLAAALVICLGTGVLVITAF